MARGPAIRCWYHRDALQRAIDHVERGCREFVCEQIAREARTGACGSKAGLVCDGLTRRLELMFLKRLSDPSNRDVFDRVIAARLAAVPEAVRGERVGATGAGNGRVSQDVWFGVHVAILDELRDPLGLPGEIGPPEPLVKVTKATGAGRCGPPRSGG